MGGDSAVASTDKRSRRHLLTLLGAGGAAALASLIPRQAVLAGHGSGIDPEALHLGQSNWAPANATTQLHANVDGEALLVQNHSTGTAARAFLAFSAGSAPAIQAMNDAEDGHAIRGASTGPGMGGRGVEGRAVSGTGVFGYSEYGPAIQAESNGHDGLMGRSTNPVTAGVHGESVTTLAKEFEFGAGIGVIGISGSGVGVSGQSTANSTGLLGHSRKTGVYGYADQDASAKGVYGRSTVGAGGYFSATTGYALRSSGRVRFEKSAGLATIAATSKTVTVTPGIDLTAGAKVLATLQTSAGGTTTVHRVVRDIANDTFTIYLTAPATQRCTVAWFVIS